MTLKNANRRLNYLGVEVRLVAGEYQARNYAWSWGSLKCFRHRSLDAVMTWAGYDVLTEQVRV